MPGPLAALPLEPTEQQMRTAVAQLTVNDDKGAAGTPNGSPPQTTAPAETSAEQEIDRAFGLAPPENVVDPISAAPGGVYPNEVPGLFVIGYVDVKGWHYVKAENPTGLDYTFDWREALCFANTKDLLAWVQRSTRRSFSDGPVRLNDALQIIEVRRHVVVDLPTPEPW